MELGVTEADFSRIRQKTDIRTLFERIGYNYKPGKFNAIFNKSIQLSIDYVTGGKQMPANCSTVRGMMMAIEAMQDL